MIVVCPFVKYSAMAIWPFILIKSDELRHDAVLIHHERIHHRQQLELLILPFYLLYLLNYSYNLLKYRNHYTAYRQIIFEREAFSCDKDLTYLKRRPIFAFWRF